MQIRASLGALIAAGVLLTACPPAEDTGDVIDTCTNELRERFPTDGATNAYYRTTVEATFREIDEFDLEGDGSDTLTVEGADGEISGSYEWVETQRRLIFTPDDPLAPNTEYTAYVDYSCDLVSWSFTTSEVGASVDPSSVEGRSYQLDLSTGRFVYPEGIGAALGSFLDQEVLVGVDRATESEIDMIGAIAEPDEGVLEQEPCEETINFAKTTAGPADFTKNPFFIVGPQDTILTVAGVTVEIEDLMISGSFSPDGTYIAGASLGGSIDTVPLVPIVNPGCDEPGAEEPCDDAALCQLAGSVGVSCEFCMGADTDLDYCGEPEGGGPYGEKCCLSLLIDSMVAEERLDADDNAWPVQELSPLGSGDEYDPCEVNPSECGGFQECGTD